MGSISCPRPGCAGVLAQTSLTELVCTSCASTFWWFGGQLMDARNHPVPAPPSARKPTPQKPLPRLASPGSAGARRTPEGSAESINPATIGEPVRALVRRDPRTVSGMPAHVFCPECRAELLESEPSVLACPGCGGCYWRRGAEIVREGEVEATDVPETQVPVARARVRKRED